MKSGKNPEDVYQKIGKDIHGVQDISMEVMGSDLEMYDEGIRLYEKFGSVATIKVALHTRLGLIVCKRLSEQGIKVNVTLDLLCRSGSPSSEGRGNICFSLCRTLGRPVSGRPGGCRSISELYRIHGIRTQVLSASIRSVQRAIRSWYNGAEICTMPPKVFDQMYDHILTDKGLEIFDQDWALERVISSTMTKWLRSFVILA